MLLKLPLFKVGEGLKPHPLVWRGFTWCVWHFKASWTLAGSMCLQFLVKRKLSREIKRKCPNLLILIHGKCDVMCRVVLSVHRWLCQCDTYQLKRVTSNVTTPFVKSAGLGSWLVISSQSALGLVSFSSSSYEFTSTLTLPEDNSEHSMLSWSENGRVIVAGWKSCISGEHVMWRMGPTITPLSSYHCRGISCT